jgi:CheY-like chemotaxis protein
MAKGVILIDDDLIQEKIFEKCVHNSFDIWQFHYFKDDQGLIEFVGKLGLYFTKIVVFCDQHLVGITGMELIDRIMKLPVYSEVKIKFFLISAEFTDEEREFAKARNVGLMLKPVNKEEIQEVLRY